MVFDNEAFELSNNLEVESLLADLPFELIKENIREQISDPLSTNINYINTVTEKCDLLKKEYEDDEDAIKEINNSLLRFFIFIITEIDEKFDLSINYDEDDVDEVVSLGEALYNFMILRYKKNISRFIYKFIIKNKKGLVEQFEKLAKKKDVTSISLKKQIKNKDDILLLSNMPSAIKYIMNLYIEPLDFLKYAADDELYEATFLRQMINTGNLTGNFVTKYLELIVDSYNDVLDEIQTDVRLKLMKKIM